MFFRIKNVQISKNNATSDEQTNVLQKNILYIDLNKNSIEIIYKKKSLFKQAGKKEHHVHCYSFIFNSSCNKNKIYNNNKKKQSVFFSFHFNNKRKQKKS